MKRYCEHKRCRTVARCPQNLVLTGVVTGRYGSCSFTPTRAETFGRRDSDFYHRGKALDCVDTPLDRGKSTERLDDASVQGCEKFNQYQFVRTEPETTILKKGAARAAVTNDASPSSSHAVLRRTPQLVAARYPQKPPLSSDSA